jgi:hypothetical protein
MGEPDVPIVGRLLKSGSRFVLADLNCAADLRFPYLLISPLSARETVRLAEAFTSCFQPGQSHPSATLVGRLKSGSLEQAIVQNIDCVEVPTITIKALLSDVKTWNGRTVSVHSLYWSGSEWDVLVGPCNQSVEDDWAIYPAMIGIEEAPIRDSNWDFGALEGLHRNEHSRNLDAMFYRLAGGEVAEGRFVGTLQLRRSPPLSCDPAGGGATSDLFPGVFILEGSVEGRRLSRKEVPSCLFEDSEKRFGCK